MKMKVVYIDDVEEELKKFKRKFEENQLSKERFEIITMKAQGLLEKIGEIQEKNPELILVDFDLHEPDKEGNKSPIFGLTLSTELKQKFQEIPIVLLTRRNVFKIRTYLRIEETLSNILDEIIYKDDLFKKNERLGSLYSLAHGFKILRENRSRRWEDLLEILKAPESDEEDLKLSNPPITSRDKWFVSETGTRIHEWSVSEAADWIRNTLIKYPGILYDSMHSATLLGISKDAFLKKPIQDFFSESKYSGVFAPSDGCWWRSRLREAAFSIMNEEEIDLPIREGFPLAWERTRGISIERSTCIFSKEPFPEWICYILNKPVMIKYSLVYRVDDRPSIMDEARVSFEAIRTRDDVNDELFDPLGREMLDEIRKMEKR